MRLALVVLLCSAACGHAPPKKAPPAERSADTLADIAGRWVTNDELDWGYSMTIATDGGIDVWIDRGKMGRCEQKGTIAPAGTPHVFRVTYTKGECNPEAVNIPIDMTVASFNGESLTVAVGDQRRTYSRAE